MGPPRALLEALEAPGALVIYGPAATGKTHLAYFLYKLLSRAGKSRIIATEPGTTAFLEHIGEAYTPAMTIDELAKILTESVLSGERPVVDSLNWHYRERPGPDAARMLAYSSSILAAARGVAVLQVSGEGRPSGEPFIAPWAGAVVETGKVRPGVFRALLLRPERRVMLFRVGPGGAVEWL